MIEVSNVSKKFRIWEDRSRDFKETAVNFLKGKRRSFRELWALKGINFEIGKGETVAFIGENGSGKSTLLKLLGGIFFPDQGKIVVHGKISALLELGVGFHPDLTGEENVYLNGSMLGFDRRVMEKRFNEIVSFSEIGDFIYSPIRTYSTGMAMRLGFSIAMCVDPDILLIDEVLAVGDEAFQKKCLKRLEEFKKARKTIVIVSHALDVVREFCDRAVLLYEGRLVTDGPPEAVIDKYHAMLSTKERVSELERIVEEGEVYVPTMNEEGVIGEEKEGEVAKGIEGERAEKEMMGVEKEKEKAEEIFPQEPKYERYGTFEAEIAQVVLRNEKGKETDAFTSGEGMSICVEIRFHRDVEDPIVGFYIRQYEDNHPVDIYGINTRWKNIELGSFKKGERIEIKFLQRISIAEGTYYIAVAVAHSDETRFYDWLENVRSFTVKNEDPSSTGMINLNSQILISRKLKIF